MKSIFTILVLFTQLINGFAQNPSQPPVNLSLLNTFDGVPLPIGFHYFEYAQYYNSGSLKDGYGNTTGNASIRSLLLMQQLTYSSGIAVLKGKLGFTILQPLVFLNGYGALGNSASSLKLTSSNNVLADLTASITLQWNHHKLFGKPFYDRIAIDATVPTGGYDDNYTINPGSHFFTIEPNYTFTYFFTKKLSTSQRHHYTYNFKIPIMVYKRGKMYHANYSLEYEALKNVRVAAMGYYLKQFTNDKAGNTKLSNSKEQVFGIGPGIHFITNIGLFVEAKCIFETGAVNRFSGTRPCLRLTYSFKHKSNNSKK